MRRLLAGLFVACLAATLPSFAESTDGFVTQIVSRASFEVGVLHVTVADGAACAVRTIYTRNEFSNRRSHLGPLYFTKGPARRSVVLQTASISCNELHLTVGDRVHLVGTSQKSAFFSASQIIRYVVRFAVPGSKKLRGLALLESSAYMTLEPSGWSGSVWLDGYPIRISPQTRLLSEPSATALSGKLRKDGTIQRKYAPPIAVLPSDGGAIDGLLKPNTWVSYQANRSDDGNIVATQLRFWPNIPQPMKAVVCCRYFRHYALNRGEAHYRKSFAAVIREPDYKNHIAGTINFHRGGPIQIVPDKGVQQFVSNVGLSVVPRYQETLPDSDPAKIHFCFYVIRPFRPFIGSGFQTINGLLPVMTEYGMVYSNPAVVPFTNVKVRDIVAVPSGLILIPDSQLALVKNKAELAALLSYAVTSIVQEQAYRIWLLQVTRGFNGIYIYQFILRMNQQVLRQGLRPMLRAGYDLREAPFAWTSVPPAQKWAPRASSKNPTHFKNISDPPWYARYSMDHLSHYYARVNYSDLNRDRLNYENFLEELRRADPTLAKPHSRRSRDHGAPTKSADRTAP